MENRTARLEIRLTQKEKTHVRRTAAKCGLSVSEYLRQRALGYAPRAILSDEVHALRRELLDLRRSGVSDKSDTEIQRLLDEIRETLILPGRDH